jgi:hypothetical protein
VIKSAQGMLGVLLHSCLLSPGAPNSPVHHRTLYGADFLPYLAKPTVGSLRAVGAPDTVRCTPDSPVPPPDRWRLGAVGAPDIVRCTPDSPVPPPDRWLGHVSRADRAADRWPGRPLVHRTVRCTPDSPMNYSRTPLNSSRERPVRLSQPGTPDTVRCTTEHCPVHHRTLSGAPRLSRVLAARAKTFPSVLFLFPALRHNTLVSKTMY